MPTLALAPVHWRVASLFVSSDPDVVTSAIYVEPAGSDKVRLVATDGPAAIAMRVRGLHDLTGPVLVQSMSKNPTVKEMVAYTAVELDGRAVERHPLYVTPELLANPFFKATQDGGVVRLDPKQMERLVRAAKLLGSSMFVQPQPNNKPCLSCLHYGHIAADEAAVVVLMPLGVDKKTDSFASIQKAWDAVCDDGAASA
jgi:hypothetical protein